MKRCLRSEYSPPVFTSRSFPRKATCKPYFLSSQICSQINVTVFQNRREQLSARATSTPFPLMAILVMVLLCPASSCIVEYVRDRRTGGGFAKCLRKGKQCQPMSNAKQSN